MLWKGRAWRKGESTKRLTIFAEKRKVAEFFSSKGKTCKEKERPLQSAEADSFPKRGSQDRGLSIKRLLKRKCLNVVRLPLTTLLCKEPPPEGKPMK